MIYLHALLAAVYFQRISRFFRVLYFSSFRIPDQSLRNLCMQHAYYPRQSTPYYYLYHLIAILLFCHAQFLSCSD